MVQKHVGLSAHLICIELSCVGHPMFRCNFVLDSPRAVPTLWKGNKQD